MNLDLIIKLVKLANNNPSDNEANLAARKVCKLIAEGNYQFNNTKSVESTNYRPTDPRNPIWDMYQDIINRQARNSYTGPIGNRGPDFKGAWNDVHRSKEPEFKSSRYKSPFTEESRTDGFWDIPNPKKDRGSKVTLTCTSCGIERETRFKGMPHDFKCYDCHWKYYQSNEAKINETK